MAPRGVDPHPSLLPHQAPPTLPHRLTSLTWALQSRVSLSEVWHLPSHSPRSLGSDSHQTVLRVSRGSFTVLGTRLSSLGWLLWSPVICSPPPPSPVSEFLLSPVPSPPLAGQGTSVSLRPCSHTISLDLDSFIPSHWLFILQRFTEHLPCTRNGVGGGDARRPRSMPVQCGRRGPRVQDQGVVVHDQPLPLAA